MGYIGSGPTRFNTADELTVTGDAEIGGIATVDALKLSETDVLLSAGETAIITSSNDVQIIRDGSIKLTATATGVDVTGVITTDGLTTSANITFGDNDSAVFGAGNDLTINHDGSNSFITDSGTGSLYIQSTSGVFIRSADGGENLAGFTDDGAVTLYHDNSLKLATTATGVDVTGDLEADGINIGTSSSVGSLTISEDTTDLASFAVPAQSNSLRIRHTSGGNMRFGMTTSHALSLMTNAADRLTVDASGNVGIGAIPETSYVQKTVLRLSSTASLIAGTSYYPYPYYIANNVYYDSSDNLKYIASSGGALLSVNAHTGGSFSFYTAPAGTAGATASLTERMRIDSSGGISKNGSFSYSGTSDDFYWNTGSGDRFRFHSGTTISRDILGFSNPNGVVGSIETSGTSTSYNETSDYRLKENVIYDWDATTRLKQLKPAQFNFISTPDETRDGFLAHEVQEVSPQSVTGTKDAMMDEEYEVSAATGDIYTPAAEATFDDNGLELTAATDEIIHSTDVERPEELEEGQQWRETTAVVMGTRSVPDYQGIDQSKLVPLLVKTIQELEARIVALETA